MISRGEAIGRARDHAPYLAESLELFPGLSEQFKANDPVAILDELFESLPDAIGALEKEMRDLRLLKRKAHLVIALSDIARIWEWDQVTEYLTRLADVSVARLLCATAASLDIKGTPENPVPGLFVLAAGKHGARELNYSSDIDFNVFYDPEKILVPNPARAERTLIKLVQGLIKGLEAMTVDGYVFRTDLRLRPDPRSNAVAVSTLTAERYYETIGQNWERAAMIKARVCAGDFESGNDFIDHVLKPFIWRRNLDYSAISDILAIKRQIHTRVDKGAFKVAGHHLKLGVGGIREIEFYAQVQQLILGGRHPDVRSMRTVDALEALADRNFVSMADKQALASHYGNLRRFEHAAQMMMDAQTHIVPVTDPDKLNFSRLCGFETAAEMESKIESILRDVHRIYSELFPKTETLSSREGNLVFTGVEPDPATLNVLVRLNYSSPKDVWQDMASWLGGRIKATRTERARELLTDLAPKIIEFCADTGAPDRAFQTFGTFLGRVNSGVALLSMFQLRPDNLRDLISLMVQSSVIAETVAAKPAILDALSDPNFLEVNEARLSSSAVAIDQGEDFEDAMNRARRWVREERFRISAALLKDRLKPNQAGRVFSIVADEVIARLLPYAIKETERRSGKIYGDIGIIGLGKLGSREMTLTSDLDIMLIYKPSDKDIDPQKIYARVTQRLISALSAITEEGDLFEVDMALRPSGRAGPVAVPIEAFTRYYQEKAWSWEFMALSRSRVICANRPDFESELDKVRQSALMSPREDLDFQPDIADMLERVRREKPPSHDWDMKLNPGGLRDLEFIAQKTFLENRSELLSVSNDIEALLLRTPTKKPKHAQKLLDIYRFCIDFAQLASIQFGSSDSPMLDHQVAAIANILGLGSVQDTTKLRDDSRAFVRSQVQAIIF